MNSLLISACLGKLLSLLCFWWTSLRDIVFLAHSCFSALWIYILCHTLSLGLQDFLWEIHWQIYAGVWGVLYVTCMWWLPFLLPFSSSLFLTSDILIMMCQVKFLMFTLFVLLWASWIWMFITLPRFSRFSIISLNKLSTLSHLCSF